jgi:hypothetical protein
LGIGAAHEVLFIRGEEMMRTSFAIAAVCAALATSPQHASAQTYQLLPRHDTDDTHVRWGLLAPGVAMFAAGWVFNGLVSLGAGQCGPKIEIYTTPGSSGDTCEGDPEWDPFRAAGAVPLVGPFVQLTLKPGDLGDDYWAAWLIADGAVQLAGLTMIVIAIADPKRRASSDDETTFVPDVAPGRAGLALMGRF